MSINLFVGLIWAIYLICLIAVKVFAKPLSQRPLRLSVGFKVFVGVLVLLHFIFYSFYVGKILIFEDDILIYPLLFVIGTFLSLAGIALSGAGYLEYLKNGLDFIGLNSGLLAKIIWPMHSGLVFIWLGVALIYNNWFGLIVGTLMVCGVSWLQVKSEEKKLLKKFEEEGGGGAYKNYLNNTGLFIPKIFKFNKNAYNQEN